MAKAESTLARHDLEARIVKHCWMDEAFHKEFLADPVGAFVKYLEVPAVSLPKITVHQEQPGSWYIVLPAKPANIDELSEAELERVAAGVPTTVTVVITALATVSASVSGGLSGAITNEVGW
jgi:hypothetical protein